jgi:hypothetical protein
MIFIILANCEISNEIKYFNYCKYFKAKELKIVTFLILFFEFMLYLYFCIHYL